MYGNMPHLLMDVFNVEMWSMGNENRTTLQQWPCTQAWFHIIKGQTSHKICVLFMLTKSNTNKMQSKWSWMKNYPYYS